MKRERQKLGERRRQDRMNEAFVRRCCNTRLTEPHVAGCVRPISRCADKIGHSSRDRAIRIAKDLEPTLGAMTAYRCKGCGAYLVDDHFTVEQLSEFTGIPENTVRAVLSKHKTRFNRLASGVWELLPEARNHAS